MENVYGFTTTPNDVYFDRVLAEASPETNFILSTERNTVADEGANASIVAIRKNALAKAAHLIPFETLCERELVDIFTEVMEEDVTKVLSGTVALEDINGNEFVLFQGMDDDATVTAKAETVRHEIRRIANVLANRVIRVTVESY